MQDFHCEVSKGLQLQHEDLPYHWKSLKILSLKCEFSVAFTWRNMPQRHRSVVPNPATSGNRQYIRNKVKQSKPIAVVQWQETSLWQTQNLSGDISRLVCRLICLRINFSAHSGAVVMSGRFILRRREGSVRWFSGSTQPAVYPAWCRHWRLTSNVSGKRHWGVDGIA